MTLLSDVQTKTKNAIAKVGFTATFEAPPDDTDYDPTTGDVTDTPATPTATIVTEAYHERLIDGDLIKQGDLKIHFAALDLGFTPSTNWKVTIDSVKWAVVNIEPTLLQGTPVLYSAQIRK